MTAPNMGARWKAWIPRAFKTILAGFLYILALPAVRNWLVNKLVGKPKTNQKIIDVVAKKE